MKTYPLHSISLEQAKQLQFKVINAVTRNFQGEEVLSLGDLGVVKGLNKPRCTVKVEKVFADTFVTCTLTTLVILTTGMWDSGLDGAAPARARSAGL